MVPCVGLHGVVVVFLDHAVKPVLMKIERIAECSLEYSAILLTCIKLKLVFKTKFWSHKSGRFRQVLL